MTLPAQSREKESSQWFFNMAAEEEVGDINIVEAPVFKAEADVVVRWFFHFF